MANVGTSTVAYATQQPTGSLVFLASDGTACVLWMDGTNQKFSYASSPYSSWTTTTLVTGLNMALGGRFRSGSDNIDVVSGGSANVRGNYFPLTKIGATYSLGTSNVITGTTAIGTTAVGNVMQYAGQDPQGRHWIVVGGASTYTAETGYFSPANSPTSTGWTASPSSAVAQTGDVNLPAGDQIGNYILRIWWNGTALQYSRADNSAASVGAWASAATIPNLTGSPNGSSRVVFKAISATQALLVYSTGSGIYAQTYNPSTNTFSTATQLSTNASDRHPTVAYDAFGNAWVFWCSFAAANSYALVYKKWNGSAWDASATTLVASGTNIANPSAGFGAGSIGITYTVGTANPYTVAWATITITSTRTIPATAALLATSTRTVGASAALLGTKTRTVGASAALAIFTDTFATNTLANYTSTHDNGGSDGTWAWSSGLITGTLGNEPALVYNGFSAVDMYTEIVTDQLDGDGGLATRWVDSNNMFVAYFRDSASAASPNTFKLYSIISGSYNLKASGSVSFTRGTSHTIRLSAYRNDITLFFDGVIIAVANDTSNTVAGKGAMIGASSPKVQHFQSFTVSDEIPFHSFAYPTDGYGIYDLTGTDMTAATYQPRLQQMAAGGFKLVMNYSILSGSTADMIGYINYAASLGMKVIVNLKEPWIWLTPAIQANAPTLYTESGNQTTDSGFTNYVINQVKNLAGTWGYYVADEAQAGNHTALKAHADIVKAADATKPRLAVEIWQVFGDAFYTYSSPEWDCCEVLGDDYYPYGAGAGQPTPEEISYGLQQYATYRGIQSAIVLQAFDNGAGPPTYSQMETWLRAAGMYMQSRVILWYAYYEIFNAANSAQHWNDLVAVIAATAPVARSIPATGALSLTRTRTVSSSVALIGTATRSVGNSGALLQTAVRTAAATAALLSTSSRISPATLTVLLSQTRTVLTSGTLSLTQARAFGTSTALLLTQARQVGASVALLATTTRSISATGALQGQATRSIPATGALSITRVVLGSVALQATSTRTVSSSVALLGTRTRTLPSSAALLASFSRSIGASTALLSTRTRTITTDAALSLIGTATRSIPATTALLATAYRSVGASAALGLSNVSRTIPVTTALLRQATRSITASTPLQAMASRQVAASAALLTSSSRTVSANATLVFSNVTRTVPAALALMQQANRVITASTPLQATGSRQVTASGALVSQASRSIPVNAALIATLTRSSGATVALIATLSRTLGTSAALTVPGVKFRDIPCSTALSGGSRVIPATVALRGTQVRSIPCTASISLLVQGLQISIPASAALSSTSTRFVLCTVALLASNASLRFRSGVADIRVRSGTVNIIVS